MTETLMGHNRTGFYRDIYGLIIGCHRDGTLRDGWMTCDFTFFLTVFQSYQIDVWMIMKGCVQWNSVYG